MIALDAGARDVVTAEHLLHELEQTLGGPADLASTHAAAGRVVLVVDHPAARSDEVASITDVVGPAAVIVRGEVATGPDDVVEAARAAVLSHRTRASGRLVRFTGRARIERVVTVAEVLAVSLVDEVTALAGTEVDDDSVLDLSEWARPTWRDGRTLLLVQRTAHGLVPFESRTQRACCSRH